VSITGGATSSTASTISWMSIVAGGDSLFLWFY
jgi:hypothetical protein